MKKAILAIMIYAALMAANTPRNYTLTLSDNEMVVLYQCLDQSNAPHSTVVELQRKIISQVEKQEADTSKSIQSPKNKTK
jgi:hypothetical protein